MPLNDPDRLLKTTDANVWAEEFCHHVGEKIPALRDERELVFCWFANAITAGELAGRRDAERGGRPSGDVDLAFQLDRAWLLLNQFNVPGLLEDAAREIKRLRAENERLCAAVQLHHDQGGDNRCHLDDMKLYHDALGIVPDPYVTALPPDAEMEESCRRYIRQRQHPDVRGSFQCMTIAQLEAEVERLRAAVPPMHSGMAYDSTDLMEDR